METVKLRYIVLRQALATLQEGVAEVQLLKPDRSIPYRLMRDGVIQRFEYCIDTFWKFIKMYLESVQQITVELSSPRAILRLALDSMLITDEECRVLLAGVADRNLTSHSYKEEMAESIQQHIPRYCQVMLDIVDRLSL